MRRKFFSCAAVVLAALLLLSACANGQAGFLVRSKTENTAEEKTAYNVSEIRLEQCCIYQTLSEEVRLVYEQIYDAVLNFKTDVFLSTIEQDTLNKAFRSVMLDHGGIFWVSGYTFTKYKKADTVTAISFTPEFTMSKEEAQEIQVRIDSVAQEILSGIYIDASDYEKTKYVFDYLASNIRYNTDAKDSQNIMSVFLNGETVCQGYASAMQYLLEKVGIVCSVVTGTADGLPHAWNIIKLDGEYYFFDVTWANTFYDNGESFIDYNYFGVTTEEMQKTHVPDTEINLPYCDAVENNYYVQENLFASEWNAEKIGALYADAYEQGEAFCSVKFASGKLYEKAVSYFIEEQHIGDFCAGLSSIRYVEDLNKNVLTIKF